MAKNWCRPLSVYGKMPFVGINSLPKKMTASRAPVLQNKITLSALPQIVSWPMDGESFCYITPSDELSSWTASSHENQLGNVPGADFWKFLRTR